MGSLFDILDREDLTCLKINYNWRTDQIVLRASKLWDNTIPWSNYNKLFYQSTPLIASENVTSMAVREALITDLHHRYAEG